MGLIRKSLAVGTVGMVNPSSKKQRVAKATQRAAEANARNTAALLRLQEEEAQREHEYKYATDLKYRTWVDQQHALAEEERRAEAQRRRDRNARIVTVFGATASFALAVVALPVIALAVWVPQLVTATASHRSPAPLRFWSSLRSALHLSPKD